MGITMMTVVMVALAVEAYSPAPLAPHGSFPHGTSTILPTGLIGKASETPADTWAYIEKFLPVARAEYRRRGIPVSVKLAQAIHESNSGRSGLARATNNHFGIKCFSKKCGKGHCKNYNDDSHKDFFRVYDSPSASFKAHSDFLHKPRYVHLQGLPPSEWALGLSEAGYATDPLYPKKLNGIISRYNLDKFDIQINE